MEDEIKAPYFDGSQPCAQVGGDFFFAEEDSGTMLYVPFVKQICNSCHFKNPCLQYALTHNVEGVWAGTGAKERSAMRTKLGIKMVEYEYFRVRD